MRRDNIELSRVIPRWARQTDVKQYETTIPVNFRHVPRFQASTRRAMLIRNALFLGPSYA